MSELAWSTVRARAIVAFRNELPRSETEQDVIDVFEQLPGVVLRAVDEVGEAVAQGKVRSGWAVLRARVMGAADAARDVTVNAGDTRARAVTAAENEIRNALLFCDREDDVLDELFRAGGLLREFAGDEALRERLVALWAEHRPRGERAEEAAAVYAECRESSRVWLAERDPKGRGAQHQHLLQRPAATAAEGRAQ